MALLTLSLLISPALSIYCNWQTPSFYSTQTIGGIPIPDVVWPGISLPNPVECGTWLEFETGLDGIKERMVCSSTKFEGSYQRESNWIFGSYSTTFDFESTVRTCQNKGVCEVFAGGLNGCQYAEYDYQKWSPRSCNASADYNAVTEDFSAKISLSCCDTGDYCNDGDDFDECTENSPLADYIDSLNVCWNDLKREFVTDLVCDADGIWDGDIVDFAVNCTEEDGSWTEDARLNADCRYKVTCADEMQQKLKTFAECSCDAAADAGTVELGDFIGTALETMWTEFCPNIEISCAESDDLVSAASAVFRKFWSVAYPIAVQMAEEEVTPVLQATLLSEIATTLNVEEGVVDITVGAGDAEGFASLNITLQLEDWATTEYLLGRMPELDAIIETETGATVSSGEATQTEMREEVLATGEESGVRGMGGNAMVMVVLMMGLCWMV